MGISRDSKHKRRKTGGRMPVHRKKRAYEKGRQQSMTKLAGEKRIRRIRVRGGNYKFRALRLNEGNFVWTSQAIARKSKIIDVVYNASSNEMVRTKALVKNAIIQIDPSPFKAWYSQFYGKDLSEKEQKKKEDEKKEPIKKEEQKGKKAPEKPEKKSRHVLAKQKPRNLDNFIDPKVAQQFTTGRLLACISSRPGQCGRADGYILEGHELEFYIRKLEKKS